MPLILDVITTGLRTAFGGAISVPNFRSWPLSASAHVENGFQGFDGRKPARSGLKEGFARKEIPNDMEPRELVKNWVVAFNRANADEMAKYYAEDAVNHQVV